MSTQAPKQAVRFSALFGPAEVICGADHLGENEVIRHLVERIGKTGALAAVQEAYETVISSACCSVAYPSPEVAVFHARVAGMKKIRVALATGSSGIRCSCAADRPASVRLVVLVLSPLKEPAGYMRIISALGRVCRKEGFLEDLFRLQDAQQVWRLFEEHDEHLPGYLTARDIMRTDFHCLRNSDSLSDAIDAFCRLGVSELPVVDEDGDLVGVVSEDELIRLCLPEYITWMDDLSSILDFEPFAEILQREKEMPVVEILVLSHRYATVEEGAPAIEVAKVMMRRDVREVLVTRDTKVVGVISIQDFIRKVLRA